jgi:hypothetical protein
MSDRCKGFQRRMRKYESRCCKRQFSSEFCCGPPKKVRKRAELWIVNELSTQEATRSNFGLHMTTSLHRGVTLFARSSLTVKAAKYHNFEVNLPIIKWDLLSTCCTNMKERLLSLLNFEAVQRIYAKCIENAVLSKYALNFKHKHLTYV